MKKNKPEEELGPSFSSVGPSFPERTVPLLIFQSKLNDHVIDLNLSKIRTDILTSRLHGWNLLQQGVKVS
jgi:hypothetical protein